MRGSAPEEAWAPVVKAGPIVGWSLALVLVTGVAARAGEEVGARLGGGELVPEEEEEDGRWTAADPEPVELPRVRLELWGRVSSFIFARFKKGPERAAHTIDVRRDTHLPLTPALGWRAVGDVRFHRDWLVGGQVGQLELDGARRRLHHDGVSLQGRYLPPLPARTRLDVWLGEVFVRYVIRDNKRVRFMLGAGAAWVSLRLRVSTRAGRSDGRVQDVLGPTVGYHVALELLPPLVVFAESTTALLSPRRFPSYASDLRLGLRLPVGRGVELGLAFSLTSVSIEDLRDLWGGGRPHASFRWRRASWTGVGGEVGVVWRF